MVNVSLTTLLSLLVGTHTCSHTNHCLALVLLLLSGWCQRYFSDSYRCLMWDHFPAVCLPFTHVYTHRQSNSASSPPSSLTGNWLWNVANGRSLKSCRQHHIKRDTPKIREQASRYKIVKNENENSEDSSYLRLDFNLMDQYEYAIMREHFSLALYQAYHAGIPLKWHLLFQPHPFPS